MEATNSGPKNKKKVKNLKLSKEVDEIADSLNDVKLEKKEPSHTIEDSNDKDKKKKKPKKVEAAVKSNDNKKKLNKAQLSVLKDALKKKEEETLKLQALEEERIRKEEEFETQRLEKIKLEEEKKMQKKLKEKEKKERLKLEGKYLTKSQKQAKARAEAMLESLRDQGFEIPPKITSNEQNHKTKKIIYEKKKIKKLDENQAPDVKENILNDQISLSSDHSSFVDEDITEIRDEWDISTSEETSNDSIDATFENHDDGKIELKQDLNVSKYNPSIEDRIKTRRDKAEKSLNFSAIRAPVICIMGHVDTGKTKILDKLRKTHVQENEAGGITQQIGATNVPLDAIVEQMKYVKGFKLEEIKVPGLLIIDTPGHESFKNLRNRGSSLCNLGVLVVDIMHGMEPQTLESLKVLLHKKIPFIIALNKVDRLHQWVSKPQFDIEQSLKSQPPNVTLEFDDHVKNVTLQFAEQGVNVALYYSNPDMNEFISMVPTSAHTGDGMGNLLFTLLNRIDSEVLSTLRFSPDLLDCSVMEVKELLGMGTTLDCILVNGTLHESDTIITAGFDGAICTQIRGLLLPQPLRDLRVKNQYEKHKQVSAAMGVKIIGKDLENALPGFPLYVAQEDDEIEYFKKKLNEFLHDTLKSIKLSEIGVCVQASTIGSLEALLDFLRSSKIPYAGINIGPLHKRDIMKASAIIEHDPKYAVILAFDVKVDKDAQELADSLKVKIFTADIIYHLFDMFVQYQEEYTAGQKDKYKGDVVFPCKLEILPQYIFKTRDPIIVGVNILEGICHLGTPICVPSKENLSVGIITSIEFNHKNLESAKKGQEVCIKIDPTPGEAPKLYGRHFTHEDLLISKITRDSIDVLKTYFRDQMQKSDWMLVVELKKMLGII